MMTPKRSYSHEEENSDNEPILVNIGGHSQVGENDQEEALGFGSKRPRTTVTPTKQKPHLRSVSLPKKFTAKILSSGPHVVRRTNDDVHSSISPCPVMWAFIDTPVFQRLRDLKQLGAASHVYMNANHTRFEHSIGVAHLAEKLTESIWKRQPKLRKSTAQKDLLCVKLAALFHDLGHGPFSHVYEDFVKVSFPQYLAKQPREIQEIYTHHGLPKLPKEWKHECCSLEMIDLCLRHLGLEIDDTKEYIDMPLRQIGDGVDSRSMRVLMHESETSTDPTEDVLNNEMILTSRDFIFIKECVWGGPLPSNRKLIGRPKREHEWLYNIVANNHSGLDVDKIDYFARDGRHCLREAGEIEMKFIDEAFVAWGECTSDNAFCGCRKHQHRRGQHLMICYPEKMIPQSLAFFKKRFDLHKKLYQHKTSVGSGLLICDIFCKADPFFRIAPEQIEDAKTAAEASINNNVNRQELPLSLAMLNPLTYVRLRDSIIDIIGFSREPELQSARDLVNRLYSRDCYKQAVTVPLNIQNSIHRRIWEKTESEIQQEMMNYKGCHMSNNEGILTLEENDFVVVKKAIHYGQKEKNPISQMRFLSKDKMSQQTNEINQLPEAKQPSEHTFQAEAPAYFIEKSIKVFSRIHDKTDLIDHVFQLWWLEVNSEIKQTPANLDVTEGESGSGAPIMLSQDSFDDQYFDYGEDD